MAIFILLVDTRVWLFSVIYILAQITFNFYLSINKKPDKPKKKLQGIIIFDDAK